jgi:hypothetical protein
VPINLKVQLPGFISNKRQDMQSWDADTDLISQFLKVLIEHYFIYMQSPVLGTMEVKKNMRLYMSFSYLYTSSTIKMTRHYMIVCK